MKAKNFIKHDGFGLFLAIATVIVQAMHSQYVLRLVSSLDEVYADTHAYVISIIISCAILYFTLRGKRKIAIGAAIFEAYMNICYYTIFILSQEEPNYWLFLVTIPVSGALPAILAFFSDDVMDGEKQQHTQEEMDRLRNNIDSLNVSHGMISKHQEKQSKEFEDLKEDYNKAWESVIIENRDAIEASKKEVKNSITSMTINGDKGKKTYKVKVN